jgi:hypothetical protein
MEDEQRSRSPAPGFPEGLPPLSHYAFIWTSGMELAAEQTRRTVAEMVFKGLYANRLVTVHCTNVFIPAEDGRLVDVRGLWTEAMEAAGFLLHSEIVLVQAEPRLCNGGDGNHSAGLPQHGRLVLPHYLVTLRKPTGEQPSLVTPPPIKHDAQMFPLSTWKDLASPVWETDGQCSDEASIWAMGRCVGLWSNAGERVRLVKAPMTPPLAATACSIVKDSGRHPVVDDSSTAHLAGCLPPSSSAI